MSTTLEQKIQELERQLAVKNAYLNVQINFGKHKLPEDVKEEVLTNLKKTCEDLANGLELATQKDSNVFDDSEIKILKGLVDTVKSRSQTPQKEAVVQKETIQPIKEVEGIRKAMLISSESIDKRIKSKIDFSAPVFVHKEQEGRVLCESQSGVRFHVPLEDVEFI